MGHAKNLPRALRILALGLVIGLAGYWAGTRWGERQPTQVAATPQATRGAQLAPDEEANVRIYRQASPAVANIITKTVEYDFFFGAVPSAGAGSGFVIDGQGHILTNLHVIQGAQRIDVILGDRSQFEAKVVGGDPRNDLALLKIETRGRKLRSRFGHRQMPSVENRGWDVYRSRKRFAMACARIPVPKQEIAEFCRRNHIRRLALFGSVLRDDFRAESDVDVLVEFEPGHSAGLLGIARMQRELSDMLRRKVDLRTPAELSPYFREEVLHSNVVEYTEG